MPSKIFLVTDPNVGKPSLPDLAPKSKLFVGAKRKAAFDQLHGLFKAHAAGDRHKDVHMIWHDDEVMDNKLSGPHIGTKDVDEEIRHAFGLE